MLTKFILAVVAVICVAIGLFVDMIPFIGDGLAWVFYGIAIIAGLFIFFGRSDTHTHTTTYVRSGRRTRSRGSDGFLDEVGDFFDDIGDD